MPNAKTPTPPAGQTYNGDKDTRFRLSDGTTATGIGSFHKTLRHDDCGEVECADFDALLAATLSTAGTDFAGVPPAPDPAIAQLTNPRGGLTQDRLTDDPHSYTMPPAPGVLSDTTAAEMTELYWMAMLRDVPFDVFASNGLVADATRDINEAFARALDAGGTDPAMLRAGIDVPGKPGGHQAFTPQTLFRLGLPGETTGPMVSQFFVRPVVFGTQTIDTRQRPYRMGTANNYLTQFDEWLAAQRTGKDGNDQAYSNANEDSADYFEEHPRYISTMRDLARFVNKDALHQAYFNATLLLLSGGAAWTPGNPYGRDTREAGFGVLGGPHILALVSEVATRALKVVWYQKWQVHLRLRPEAYGGLAHVQQVGNVSGTRRPYGLPAWLFQGAGAALVRQTYGSYLLPMAYTPGSPTHPAYGAGHATVAGACVTVLKAFFAMLEPDRNGIPRPIPFTRLVEGDQPYGAKPPMKAYITGLRNGMGERLELGRHAAGQLTVEGELNKLAHNVAMGRSMGGVHWRTDNARSLVLGEAIAARILCDITQDAKERPVFTFRTFARRPDGQPRTVVIAQGGIEIDGNPRTGTLSEL